MPASVAASRGDIANEIAATAAAPNPSTATGSTTAASRGGSFAPALTRGPLPALRSPTPCEVFPTPVPDRHGESRDSDEERDQASVLPLQHVRALRWRIVRCPGMMNLAARAVIPRRGDLASAGDEWCPATLRRDETDDRAGADRGRARGDPGRVRGLVPVPPGSVEPAVALGR